MNARLLRGCLVLIFFGCPISSQTVELPFHLAPPSELKDERGLWDFWIEKWEGDSDSPDKSAPGSAKNNSPAPLDEPLDLPDLTGASPRERQIVEAWVHLINQMTPLRFTPPSKAHYSGAATAMTAQEIMEELGLMEEDLKEIQTSATAWLYLKLLEEERNRYSIAEEDGWESLGIEDPDKTDEAAPFTHHAWVDCQIDHWLAAQKAAETSL